MARRLGSFLLVVAAVLLAVPAYWLLFTTLMAYDDEGYVLVSLKNYSAHGGLYREVFSQYGPFFYFLHDAGHRLFGYGFTNTSGRLITLLCWLVAAGGGAQLVWRLTRSLALSAFTLGLTFFHLHLMVSEPSHPGGMIAVLVALAAWLGATQIQRGAPRALAVTAGLAGAALLLTKINVGVFFLASAGIWFVVQLRGPAQARVAAGLGAAALVVLPFGLMRAVAGEESGRLFIGLSVVASLTLLAVAWRERQPLTSWSHAAWGAGALLGLGTLVLVIVGWRGTGWHDLVEGVVLGPLRHPGVYHFSPAWKPGAALAGGVSLVLAGLVWRGPSRWLDWLIVGLRLGLVSAFALACLEWLPFSSHGITMSYLMPLAWIFALRLETDKPGLPANPAIWLGLLLVLQYLHAYPVAGSQVAWGTFLIVPLMALGLHDTQSFVGRHGRPLYAPIIGLAALAVAVGSVGRLVSIGWLRYTGSQPLQLAGAEDVRLPEATASAVRLLALNATAHADVLLTLPGMFSFNQWTGLPTPTLANATHWFSLLNRRQQEEIIDVLQRSPRPAFIAQRYLLNFLEDSHIPMTGPLHDYLQQNFVRAFSVEYFEFWIRRDRSIAPLGVVEIYALKTPEPGVAPGKLEVTVAIPPGHQVASIEVVPLDGPPRMLARWDKTSGLLLATAVNLQGEALTNRIFPGWEQPLPALVRLTLPLEPLQTFDRPKVVVHLRDASGALLAEARFKD